MALLLEYEQKKKPPTSMASFNLALDPSNPLGFLAKVFDFVAKESHLFKSDSDVNAVVRMVKAYKVESEEKNSRVSGFVPPVQPPAISTTTCIDAATANTLTTVTPSISCPSLSSLQSQPPSLSHVSPEVVTVNQYPAAAATLAAIQSASAASPQLPISSSFCLGSLSSLLQNPDFLNALSPISSHISLLHLQSPVPSSPVLPLTPLPIPDLTRLVPIKLETDNYLLWKSLISSVLISYDLYGYVDGSIVCPSPSYFIIDGFGRSIPNPSHSHWIRTNSSVKSWLMATMSQDILVEVHNLSTSRDIWVVLETRFIQQSTMYKIELSNIKKGDLSCDAYLRKIKTLADNLAAVIEPVSSIDLVIQTLNGLPKDYEDFVTTILLQSTCIDFDDLRAKLLQFEHRLLQLQSTQPAFFANSPNSRTLSNGGRNGRGLGRDSVNGCANCGHSQPQQHPQQSFQSRFQPQHHSQQSSSSAHHGYSGQN